MRVSQLNLVDLAGSERASHTAAQGLRLKEGGHINKSLLALGSVIGKLSEKGSSSTHIPYRDSKLTRILQPSLGGNAKTGIICTVTPAVFHLDESLSTLRFASKCTNVTNKPQVNEIVSDATMLQRHQAEIARLKKQLEFYEQQLDDKVDKTRMDDESAKYQDILKKFEEMTDRILDSEKVKPKKKKAKRRQTWFPGVVYDEQELIPIRPLSPMTFDVPKTIETRPTPIEGERDTMMQVIHALVRNKPLDSENVPPELLVGFFNGRN